MPPAKRTTKPKEERVKTRELLLTKDDGSEVRVVVNAKHRLTFGPWSVPGKNEQDRYGNQGRSRGTLRVYEGTSIIAVFSGVVEFRDLSMETAKLVVREEGRKVWKRDDGSYESTEGVTQTKYWQEAPALPDPKEEF